MVPAFAPLNRSPTGASQATASHEHGVLTVAVPLRPHPPARRITVTSTGGEPAPIEPTLVRDLTALDFSHAEASG